VYGGQTTSPPKGLVVSHSTCPPLSLGIRTCAADQRYIHDADSDRGDVIIPVSEVRKLISLKELFDQAVATVWLTTAEMGFSLTNEPHMVICSRDIREGEKTDRYLQPAFLKFAIAIQAEEEREPTLDPEKKELLREIVNLHQPWGKVREGSTNDETRE
jgi:hypothetical protein